MGARSNRLDWLDALRGWAIFSVVVVHCGQVADSSGVVGKLAATGQYGVQLFFVISALTISITYESHASKYGSWWQVKAGWLIKRFFRIAPLYYVASVMYPVRDYLIYLGSHHSYGRVPQLLPWLSNILFVHTWVPSGNNSVVPGGWSIGVEMFFYLLVPLIWMVSRKHRAWVLSAGVFAGLATTFVVAKIATGAFFVEDASFLYYWFPTQAPVFALGLIFYMYGCHRLGEGLSGLVRTGFVAIALMFVSAGVYCGTWAHTAPALAPTIICIGFLLIIASLGGWTRALLVRRPMIFLGQISYSVYIFHFAMLSVSKYLLHLLLSEHHTIPIIPTIALTLAGACCIGVISKRFVEDPAIRVGAKLCDAVIARALFVPKDAKSI